MSHKNINILVVDDQPGVRFLLETVISSAGYAVDTAQNGLEAVEKVKTLQPDLVFMDVRMPFMGGIEALGKIKALTPATDVVLMTAYGSDDTLEQADRQGSLCCMSKPFDIDAIKKFLDEYAENKLILNKADVVVSYSP